MRLVSPISAVLTLAALSLAGCILPHAVNDPMLGAQAALPGEGWLYSYSHEIVNNQSQAQLLKINATSAEAHQIGLPIIGRIEALAFDDVNGVLYGAWRSAGNSNSSQLVTIDWYTGDVTFVGQFLNNDNQGGANRIVQGMTLSPDGDLLAVGQSPQRLLLVDPSTGAFDQFPANFAQGAGLNKYGATFVDSTLHVVNTKGSGTDVHWVDGSGNSALKDTKVVKGDSMGTTTDDQGTFYFVLDSKLYTFDYTLDPAWYGDSEVDETHWDDLDSLAWIQEPAENGPDLDIECPCEYEWKNHGEYVVCVVNWAKEYAPFNQRGEVISEAGRSDCGKPPHAGGPGGNNGPNGP